MPIELCCPRCPCRLSALPHTPAEDVLEHMTEEGPWFALADGATFEDMIFAALSTRGTIRCPECGRPVAVNEEGLEPFTPALCR